MKQYIKPNFLLVGAAKSGTTNLYHYLSQHPDIYIPNIKECRYFSKIGNKRFNPYKRTITAYSETVDNPDDYYQLYRGKEHYKIRGDISPDYLFYYKESIINIKKELGSDVKILIILRNPVERTYSNYLHHVRGGEVAVSFEEMLKNEAKLIDSNCWYSFYLTKCSFYYDAVKSYMDNFKFVKVITFEDFIKNQEIYLKEICEFLNIDVNFAFQRPKIRNKTGVPKSKLINNVLNGKLPFIKQIKRLLFVFVDKQKFYKNILYIKERNLEKPELDIGTRNMLRRKFKDDISKLEGLLGSDFSFWLE